MQRLFEYRLEGSGDALSLAINMDSVTAKALSRLDRRLPGRAGTAVAAGEMHRLYTACAERCLQPPGHGGG